MIGKLYRALFVAMLLLLLSSFVVPQNVSAQTEFEDAIKQLSSENTKGYLQPFVNAFGSNMNAGLYRTAHVSRVGLHVYVGLVGMFTMIPEEDKTFMGIPPAPWPQEPVETATIFGGQGAVVTGPGGLEYRFQNGQIEGDVVPFFVPHIEIGSFMGTMVKLRYAKVNYGDMPEISLIGYGVQHSISQYLFLFPIDLSVGFFQQKLEIGDIFSATATSIGVQASKSLVLLTVYGAAAYETAKVDVSYTYEGGTTPEEISLTMESENHFRITVGARLRLGFLILNGDYSVGAQSSASVGIGVGL